MLKQRNFLSDHFSETMMIALFVAFSAFILWQSYFAGSYIFPDTSRYLLAAESILSGNGFRSYASAGWNDYYFSHWPIGYPFLVACVAYVTGAEVYLASKILSILILGAIFVLLYLRFRRRAWVYALIMIGLPAVVYDFLLSLSEQPFLLGSLWLIFEISDVIFQDKPKKYHYFNILLASLLMFLVRYVGSQAIGILCCAIVYCIVVQIRRKKSMIHKIVPLLIVTVVVALVVCIYLYMNYLNTGYAGGSYAHAIGKTHSFSFLIESVWSLVCGQIKMIQLFLFFVLIVFLVLFLLMKRDGSLTNDQKSRKFFRRYLFLFIAALFCDFAFLVFRFITEVDEDFRRHLLVPTVLILFGVITMFYESDNVFLLELRKYLSKHKMQIFIITIFFCSIPSLRVVFFSPYESKGPYRELRSNFIDDVSQIPSQSIVITTEGHIVYSRPDLIVLHLWGFEAFVKYPELMSKTENVFLYFDTDYIPWGEALDNMQSSPLLKDYVYKREKRLIKVK